MISAIDLTKYNLNMPAPVEEPERQYFFMAKAQKYVAELTKELGRKPTCCVTTFGCQMNSRDSEKLVGILELVVISSTLPQ